jgi:hypothetical protein
MNSAQVLLVQLRDRLDGHMAASSKTQYGHPGMIDLSDLMELTFEGDATSLTFSDPEVAILLNFYQIT